jgi:hypothetical protein
MRSWRQSESCPTMTNLARSFSAWRVSSLPALCHQPLRITCALLDAALIYHFAAVSVTPPRPSAHPRLLKPQ